MKDDKGVVTEAAAPRRAARSGPTPVGGTLVDRVLTGTARDRARDLAPRLPRLTLTLDQIVTLEMIATGVLSPLQGYPGSEDYASILDRGRLADGTPWTLPPTLAPADEDGRRVVDRLKEGDAVALVDQAGAPVAILHLQEQYGFDKNERAQKLFGTTERRHPGVDAIFRRLGDVSLAGPIDLIDKTHWGPFEKHRLEPKDAWRLFHEVRGWNTVVAFQTANPLHRGHEHLQKCALEIFDGLFIHPVVETTRRAYFRNEFRIQAYEVALREYFPADRVAMAPLRITMQYAGPREAILHALIRRNFGCTHFIVGRDHAGFGNFYDPYASQQIFSDYGRDELGIEPIFFRESFYCTRCGAVASEKTCPHGREQHITMSGTGVQDILRYGFLPPKEVLRPEVGQVILQGIQPKGKGPDGHAIKPVGETIKGLFPSYLTHTRLGGPKRPQPLDPKSLNARDLEAALRDTRDNASRVYERVYETFATLFDIERGASSTLVDEARRKAIAIQEELIRALEQKLEIATESVEDPYMYQDRDEVARELEVARRILGELRGGGDGDFRARVWNQRPYEDYRS
ncbi:MAG TPA: sulfate adenylyltransferase [Candidatus Polarisedimenticolia bacterium]|jgi:sulfate adenylyltransferase|nr:sulfate adenylyltransferase [Candidatus Polarisedimenticolia bacterium]